jgi:hypothetical protein
MKGDEVTDLRARVEAVAEAMAHRFRALGPPLNSWTDDMYRREAEVLLRRLADSGIALLDQPAPPDTALTVDRVADAMGNMGAAVIGRGSSLSYRRAAAYGLLSALAAASARTIAGNPRWVEAMEYEAATAPTPPDGLDVPECDREKWCDMPGGHSGRCRNADEVLDQPAPPDTGLLTDHERRRIHTEETTVRRETWACVPLVDAVQAVHDAALDTASTPPDGLEALVREFLSLHDEADSPVIWCDGKCRTVRALRAAAPPEPAP